MKAARRINGLKEKVVPVYWQKSEQQNPARKQLPLHWPVKNALLRKSLGSRHPDKGRKLSIYAIHCNRGEHLIRLGTKIA